MQYEFVPHVFAQGHTIEGAIRLHNSLTMLDEHIELMVDVFNDINKDVFPPIAGQVVKIPVMPDYQDEAPVIEPKEKETPKLPPLRQVRKKVERQVPKKKDPKKVHRRLHWWK